MKLLSYLSKLCLAVFLIISAQAVHSQPDIYIGGRAGINVGSFKWDATSTSDKDLYPKSIIGPHVSFVTVLKLAPWFGIQGEAAYVQRGAKLVWDVETFQGQNEQGQAITFKDVYQVNQYKTHYIDVPLFARFQLGSDNFAFTLKLGPTFSIALSGTERVSADAKNAQGQDLEIPTQTKSLNFDKDYNRFDIAATGAIGTEISAGPGAVIVDLRYLLGLNDLNAKSRKIDDRVKNRGFQIGVGYIVRI